MIEFLVNKKGLEQTESWKKNCWINIEIPTKQDKDYILDSLKIPEEFYNDIEDIDERSRIEIENGWTFVLLRIPYKDINNSYPYTTVPLGILFKEDFFITICFYKTDFISDFVSFSRRKDIIKQDNFEFVLRFLLSSSVWFLKYLKQINQEIKFAENKLEKSIRNEEVQALFNIEKSLVYFTTSLRGNDTLLQRLKNLINVKNTFSKELIEDVEIELRQALETTKIFSNILSGMRDAYASVISNNLNVIMKRLTSISIILMLPAVIANFYGMNVPNSLQNNPFGFWIIILISLVTTIIGVLFLLKKRWF
jgi:magnesium transporter